jgi:hypothetical protein
MKSYDVINDKIAYNHMEKKEEWVRVEHKSHGQRKRQNKRYRLSEETTDREVILHNIPTLINGAPAGKESDGTRVIKILKELHKGGYKIQNGDVTGTGRQVRNNRKVGFQPITITLRDADTADEVKLAASEVGLLNERKPKPNDLVNDNIGYLRRSLSEKERKKIGNRAKFHESAQGKALKEIRKREYESTTNESEWSKINVEDNEPMDTTGTKEASEKDKTDAAQTAIRKMAEAAKEFQQSNANSENSSDLGNRMATLLKEMEKTDAENRKKTEELANHETPPAS